MREPKPSAPQRPASRSISHSIFLWSIIGYDKVTTSPSCAYLPQMGRAPKFPLAKESGLIKKREPPVPAPGSASNEEK